MYELDYLPTKTAATRHDTTEKREDESPSSRIKEKTCYTTSEDVCLPSLLHGPCTHHLLHQFVTKRGKKTSNAHACWLQTQLSGIQGCR